MSGEVVGQAIYEADIDTSKLNEHLQGTNREIAQTGAQAEKAFSGQGAAAAQHYGGVVGFVKSQFGDLKGQLAAPEIGHGIMQGIGLGGGLAAFSLVEEGIKGVVDAAGEAVKAYEDAQVADAKLSTALKNNVPDWTAQEGVVNNAAQANIHYGFTVDQTKDSLSTLVTFTHDATKAVQLQGIAMDLARAKNLDLETSTKIIGKVFEGNTGILARYGIAVHKGADAAEALSAIQQAVGGQADAYSHTLEGQKAAIDAEANSIQIKIGQVAQPIMKSFFDFLSGPGMDAVNAAVSGLGNLGDGFNNLNRFVNPGIATVQDFTKATEDQAKAMGIDKDAIDQFITAQQGAQQATHDGMAQVVLHQGVLGDLNRAIFGVDQSTQTLTATQQVQVQTQLASNAAISAYNDDARETTSHQQANIAFLQQQSAATAALSDARLTASANMRASEQQDVADAAAAAAASKAALDAAAQNAATAQGIFWDQTAANYQKAIGDALKMGEDIPAALSKGMTDAKSAHIIEDADKQLQDILKNGLSPQQQALEAMGRQNVKLIEQGMNSEKIGAKETAQALAVASIKSISDAGLQGAQGQKGLKAIGQLYDELLGSGMTNDQAKTALAAAGVSANVISTLGGKQAQSDAYGAGQTLARTYLGGFKAGADAYDYKAMLNTVDSHLHGASPPPKGPLHDIDKWGSKLAETYLGGFKGFGGFGDMLGGILGPRGGSSGSSGSGSPAAAMVSIAPNAINITVNGAADPKGTADAVRPVVRQVLEQVLRQASTLPLSTSGRPV